MPVLSNPHTHTTHVDGKNTARDMAARAIELGFSSLGFSEHARQEFDMDYALNAQSERAYIDDVRAVRDAYSGILRVWLGIERDRAALSERVPYEYVIGASHYFIGEDGGFCGIDGDADTLKSYVDARFSGDWMRAAESYYGDYAEYISAYKPDIIAHFDLIAKRNRQRFWFDESDRRYLNAGYQALERMLPGCDVMEVNTGGMARSAQPCPYPIPAFLKRWRELGGRVIVSSDCHRAHQMDAWFERADDYLRQAGYTSQLVLGAGKELFDEVKI